MSAIYLAFRPGGLSPAEQDAFRGRASAATGYPGKALDFHESELLCAAASHHGCLPSGGVAADADGAAVVAGSCWLDTGDERMATPARLLEVWRAAAPDGPRQLAGLFSFAYCDNRRRQLVVETDHFGSMPLYAREDGRGGVEVASEIKFLLRPGQDKVDEAALAEFVALGFLAGHDTLVAGIRRLRADARLTWGPEGAVVQPFPGTTYRRDRTLDEAALAEYDGYVARYLNRFRGAADSFGLSLSGGLDSRLVAYAARRAGLPFTAFTTGEAPGLDTHVARRVAAALDAPIACHWLDPREMPRWFAKLVWFTEGRVHPNHMHYMSANLHRKVPPGPLLHGLGLESVLGGHWDDARMAKKDAAGVRKACRAATTGLNYWPDRVVEAIHAPRFRPRIDEAVPRRSEELLDRIGFSGVYGDYLEYRTQLKGVGWANPCFMSQVLPWSDVVNPFFDHQAFDFGTTIRAADVTDRAGQLRWGLGHFPGFADIPRVKSGILIPVSLETPRAYDEGMRRRMQLAKIRYYVTRLSRGRINLPYRDSFPQYLQWYPKHRVIRRYVDGILLSDRTLDRGTFTRAGMRVLLRDCRIGRNVWGSVGTLLVAELFQRQFIDGDERPADPRVPWGV